MSEQKTSVEATIKMILFMRLFSMQIFTPYISANVLVKFRTVIERSGARSSNLLTLLILAYLWCSMLQLDKYTNQVTQINSYKVTIFVIKMALKLTLSLPTPWLLCVAWGGGGMDSTIINISALEGARRLIFQHDVHLFKINQYKKQFWKSAKK